MDHEDFKRMAMNKSFPRTQDLIQSVQPQVETLIERKDEYTLQVSQGWKTFRWSRITLLSDPAANLIQMKVQTCSQTLQDEHGFAGQLEAIPKLVLHNATELASFATQIKPGHWCFLEPASEKTWWNGYLNEPQGPGDTHRIAEG